MRKKFPAYYRTNRDRLIEKFEDFVFVYDASSLLDVFRLNQESTEEVINVIKHYAAQIIVPFQAAKEYNCNIHRVLKEQLQNINSAEKTLESFTRALRAKRQQPYISSATTALLEKLQKRIKLDFKGQRDYVERQLIHGDLINKMADLLDEKVLNPFSNDEIEEIKNEGKTRYAANIPPGYKDEKKDDNQYGDLIIWKEILRFAKEKRKCILYVTNDAKEDWVIKEEGKTIGPRYDLIEEFYNEVGDSTLIFHVYTLDRFLDFIREKNNTIVSETTIDNVREIVRESSVDLSDDLKNDYINRSNVGLEQEKASGLMKITQLEERYPIPAKEKIICEDKQNYADSEGGAKQLAFDEPSDSKNNTK